MFLLGVSKACLIKLLLQKNSSAKDTATERRNGQSRGSVERRE